MRWSARTPDVFAIIEPVLKAFCENIFHVGGPGSGHKTKLVYNFLTMGQAALISEALIAAAKSGLRSRRVLQSRVRGRRQ